MYESDDKMVSHPKHYISKNGLEVIDVIEAFTADLEGIEATDTGNIIKYACRWKQKGGVQDLKKIMWYAQHLIDRIEDESHWQEDAGDESNLIYTIMAIRGATEEELNTISGLFKKYRI